MSKAALAIKSIEHVRGHLLRFHFSDGHINEVDFKPWIASLPTEEEHTYLETSKFKEYRIHLGHAIMWGEYDIIFPLEAVYHGDPDLLAEGDPVSGPGTNTKKRQSERTRSATRERNNKLGRKKVAKVKS